ncbi:MAG: acid-activated urea channel [Lachnospiraceae bacterium]|nr:acid-activated urea channel [Lachnospiraceae bacterium]
MLGVCLLFVGIVLINNGICSLSNVDKKAAAVMNIFTGTLSLFINFTNLVQGNYYAAGTGLLFCFTYLFVAIMDIFDVDGTPFAWFSTFVAVNAIVFGIIEGVTGSASLGIDPDWRWAAIWWLWAILWGSSFFTDILGMKKLAKYVPALQILEGVITAWIPGVMLMLGVW